MKILNLSAQFEGSDTKLFNQLSIDLPNKGLYVITGRNGSGKSILLKLMDGEYIVGLNEAYDQFDVTYQNKIKLDATDVLPLNWEELDLINMICEINGISAKGYEPMFKHRTLETYSLGEQKLVTFRLIKLIKFDLILLDEFIANLDEDNLTKVMAVLNEMALNCLIIVVSNEKSVIDKIENRIEIGNNEALF